MGNSTITLRSVVDTAAAKGIPSPLSNPAGYGVALALQLATDVMADLLSQRFNWKWNSKIAPSFLTNAYQQDYPQVGVLDIDWLEDSDRIDVNNPSIPQPVRPMIARRGLSPTHITGWPIEICWLYNRLMNFGIWPGAGKTFYPLLGTSPVPANALMSMIDSNGNMLIVTTTGITGVSAPSLPANAAEGTTVNDGSVIWTVVSPYSQGFRISPLPGTGQTWKIYNKYQISPPVFTTLDQLIDPIPDGDARLFRVGYEWQCKGASPNPSDRSEFAQSYPRWLNSLKSLVKQGDEESDAYALIPASYPVEPLVGYRNPLDPSQPY